MSRFFKSAAFPILIVVVLAFFAQKLFISQHASNGPVHTYQTLVSQDIPSGNVKDVQIRTKDNVVDVTLKNNQKYEVGYVDGPAAADLINALQKAPGQPQFNVEGKKSNSWLSLLTYILPFIIFIGFWIFLMNQVQGGGSKVMSFGKSRAKRMSVDSPKITF